MAVWKPKEDVAAVKKAEKNPILGTDRPIVVIQSSEYPLSVEQKLDLFVNAFMSEFETGVGVFAVSVDDLDKLDELYKDDESICVFIVSDKLHDREKYHEAMEGTFHGVLVIPYKESIRPDNGWEPEYQYPKTKFSDVEMVGFSDTLILLEKSFRERHKAFKYNYLSNKALWEDSANKLKLLVEDPKSFINQWVQTGKKLNQDIIRGKKYLSYPLWRDRHLWPLWNLTFHPDAMTAHFPFAPNALNDNFNEAKRRVFFCDTFMSFLPFYTEWNLRPEDMAFFDYSSVPSEHREERSLKDKVVIAKLPYDLYEVLTQYQYSFPHDQEYHNLLAYFDAIWWFSSVESDSLSKQECLLYEYKSKYQSSQLYSWKRYIMDAKEEVHLIFTDTSKDFLWLLKDKDSFDTEDLLRVIFWMYHLDQVCQKLCKYECKYCVIIPDSDTIKILRKVYNFLPQELWNGVIPELFRDFITHEMELTFWPNELISCLLSLLNANGCEPCQCSSDTDRNNSDIGAETLENALPQKLSEDDMSNQLYIPQNVDEYQKSNMCSETSGNDQTSNDRHKFYEELFDLIDTFHLLVKIKGEEAYQLIKKYKSYQGKEASYFPEMIKKMTFLARLYAKVDKVEYK